MSVLRENKDQKLDHQLTNPQQATGTNKPWKTQGKYLQFMTLLAIVTTPKPYLNLQN